MKPKNEPVGLRGCGSRGAGASLPFVSPRRSSSKISILGVAGTFATGLALFWAVTASCESFPAQEAGVGTGIIEPFLDVTLSAPVPGIVISRKFEEGSLVKEGALLLELDNSLERLEVERRKIVQDQKRDDFESTKRLYGTTKGISKEELDKKEAEYRVAAVEHDMALEQLRRRQLIAPNAGVITDIMLEVGEACQPYQSLIRLVDIRRCYLVTNVEPKEGSRLRPDMRVTIQVDLGDDKTTVPGKIVFLSPVIDPASGLQELKILFENQDGRIRPGLTGIMLSATQG